MKDLTNLTLSGWTFQNRTEKYSNRQLSNGKKFLDIVHLVLLTTPEAYVMYDAWHNEHPISTRWLATSKGQLSASGANNNRAVAYGLLLDNNTSNNDKDRCIRQLCDALGYEYGVDIELHWEKKLKIGMVVTSASPLESLNADMLRLIHDRFPDADFMIIDECHSGTNEYLNQLDMVIMTPLNIGDPKNFANCNSNCI